MHPIIQNNLEIIKALCSKHHVKELYVFGSAVRGDFNEKSDVDFLAKFNLLPNVENLDELSSYFKNLDELKSLLQKTLRREVDLIEEKNIKNTYLIENINKEKQLLYAKAG
jgi:predicted nucleotidyltransferase